MTTKQKVIIGSEKDILFKDMLEELKKDTFVIAIQEGKESDRYKRKMKLIERAVGL